MPFCDTQLSLRTPILARGATAGQKTYDESSVEITSQYTREWSEEFAKVMNQAAEVFPISYFPTRFSSTSCALSDRIQRL